MDLPKVRYEINERKPRIPTWKPQTTRLNVSSGENIGKSTASVGNEEGGIYPMRELLGPFYFLFFSLFESLWSSKLDVSDMYLIKWSLDIHFGTLCLASIVYN